MKGLSLFDDSDSLYLHFHSLCVQRNIYSSPASTYSAFIVQNLDLSRVTQFDHGSHRDVKLSARFKVQPHIVPLDDDTNRSVKYSISLHRVLCTGYMQYLVLLYIFSDLSAGSWQLSIITEQPVCLLKLYCNVIFYRITRCMCGDVCICIFLFLCCCHFVCIAAYVHCCCELLLTRNIPCMCEYSWPLKPILIWIQDKISTWETFVEDEILLNLKARWQRSDCTVLSCQWVTLTASCWNMLHTGALTHCTALFLIGHVEVLNQVDVPQKKCLMLS